MMVPPPKVRRGITIAHVSASPHYNMGGHNKAKGKFKMSRGAGPEWQHLEPFFNGPSRRDNAAGEDGHDQDPETYDPQTQDIHPQDDTGWQLSQNDAGDPFPSQNIPTSSGGSALYHAREPAVSHQQYYAALPIHESSGPAEDNRADQHGNYPESSFVHQQSEQSGQPYDPTAPYSYGPGGNSSASAPQNVADVDQVEAQFSGMSMNEVYDTTRSFDPVDSTSTGVYRFVREDIQQSEHPAYAEQAHDDDFDQNAADSGYDPGKPLPRKKGPIFLKLSNKKNKPKILEGCVDRHVPYPVIDEAQVVDLGLRGRMTSCKSTRLATTGKEVSAVGGIELEWEEVDRGDHSVVLSSGVDSFYVVKRPPHHIHVPLTFGQTATTYDQQQEAYT